MRTSALTGFANRSVCSWLLVVGCWQRAVAMGTSRRDIADGPGLNSGTTAGHSPSSRGLSAKACARELLFCVPADTPTATDAKIPNNTILMLYPSFERAKFLAVRHLLYRPGERDYTTCHSPCATFGRRKSPDLRISIETFGEIRYHFRHARHRPTNDAT